MSASACVCTLLGESACPMRRSVVEMRGARSSAVRLLLLICCVCAAAGYPFRTPLDLDVTPRVTVLSNGKHGHKHTVDFVVKWMCFRWGVNLKFHKDAKFLGQLYNIC